MKLTKLTISLLILLLFTAVVKGQVEEQQVKNYIGINAGGSVSSVFFNHLAFRPNVRTSLLPGAQVGLVYRHFSPLKTGILNTGLQLSVYFSQKGYIQEFQGLVPNVTSRLNYVEVPFSAMIYFGRKKTKFFVNPGIYIEYLLSSTVDSAPEDDDEDQDFINVGPFNVFPYNQNTDNRVGIGGRIEGALSRDFPFGTIQLAGNFSYTITNLLDFGLRSSGIPDTSNNFSVGVTIGYFFGIGGKKPVVVSEEE
ncbi:MAG: outer membrane beta-barrel protein [Bacteroidota bacterium]